MLPGHGLEELEGLPGAALVGVEVVHDVEGHDLDVHPPLAHPRDVDLPARQPVPDVQALVQHAVGQVVVAIPDEGVAMELVDVRSRLPDPVRGAGPDAGRGRDEDEEPAKKRACPFHDFQTFPLLRPRPERQIQAFRPASTSPGVRES